ncbi:MAG: type II toxin-antitoxin system VapC family toxin, partial [Treponema sp.]
MYIIDTHALLWYLYNSSEISEKARQIIDNEEQIFTSIASLWEIAIKQSIGKLDLEYSITQIENLCKQKAISVFPIVSRHLDELISLPNHHNDPF